MLKFGYIYWKNEHVTKIESEWMGTPSDLIEIARTMARHEDVDSVDLFMEGESFPSYRAWKMRNGTLRTLNLLAEPEAV